MRSRRARGGREEKELGLRGSTAEVMDERVGSVRNLKKKKTVALVPNTRREEERSAVGPCSVCASLYIC